MLSTTILMVDDDPTLVRLVELHLTQASFRFVSASHGIAGLQLLEHEHPALVLLDIAMPKLDGWETCRLMRLVSQVPIIMLTARDDEVDKAHGLDLGADDYLTKPFSFVELQARIRAALRRAEMPAVGIAQANQVFHLGALTINIAAHQITDAGNPVPLTPTEFRLLAYLLTNVGLVLTHQQLLSEVWGMGYRDATELLKPVISRLRQKIEPDLAHPTLIQTVHGIGYRLTMPTNHE